MLTTSGVKLLDFGLAKAAAPITRFVRRRGDLSPPIMFPAHWSPDGRYLTYYRTDPTRRNDIWVLPLFGNRKPFPLIQTEFNEWQPQFSPDGKWIAYVSDDSGSSQVYVQAFPMQSGRIPISIGGGMQPRWRRDGKELFYLAPDRKLMAVTVTAGATFEVDSPRPLFQTTLEPAAFRQTYDVSADGNRFLLNTPVKRSHSRSRWCSIGRRF
jgi:dipeptidyl aminopeptidase/acylaminoacyl peptidase